MYLNLIFSPSIPCLICAEPYEYQWKMERWGDVTNLLTSFSVLFTAGIVLRLMRAKGKDRLVGHCVSLVIAWDWHCGVVFDVGQYRDVIGWSPNFERISYIVAGLLIIKKASNQSVDYCVHTVHPLILIHCLTTFWILLRSHTVSLKFLPVIAMLKVVIFLNYPGVPQGQPRVNKSHLTPPTPAFILFHPT